MKRTIFSLVILIFTLHGAFAQKGYTVTCNIQGLEDGQKITLTPGATHKQEKSVCEAIVNNGSFSFSGKLEEPRLFYMEVDGINGATALFIENSDIQVNGKVSVTEMNNAKRATFSDMIVKGSKAHDFFIKTVSVRDVLDKAHTAYYANNKVILDSISKYQRGSAERKKLEESDAYKKFATDEHDFFAKVDETFNRVFKENSNTFWGPLFMMSLTTYLTDAQKPVFETMSPEAKNSYYGKLVKAELFPEGLVGKIAPAFTAVDREGKKFSLKELKGKYTIIDFWASWCVPCRKEIPNMKKLYAKYNSKGLVIISVSLDKEDAKWKKALDEEQLSWPNLIDKDGISDKYSIKTIPAMFVIDKNCKVIGEKLRGESLADKLKELFGE